MLGFWLVNSLLGGPRGLFQRDFEKVFFGTFEFLFFFPCNNMWLCETCPFFGFFMYRRFYCPKIGYHLGVVRCLTNSVWEVHFKSFF